MSRAVRPVPSFTGASASANSMGSSPWFIESPRPSAPLVLSPQHLTAPVEIRMHACLPSTDAATFAMFVHWKQPSPVWSLPSSHASPGPTSLSPQTCFVQSLLHAAVSLFCAPRSHSSPESTTPLPQRSAETHEPPSHERLPSHV